MATARWTHSQPWHQDAGARPNRRSLFIVLGLLALLAADVAMLEIGRARVNKIGANRTLSPLDTSLAPPSFLPGSAIKVKRTARVMVFPEKKKTHSYSAHRSFRSHRARRSSRRRHTTQHAAKSTAPPSATEPVVQADCKAVEPPMP